MSLTPIEKLQEYHDAIPFDFNVSPTSAIPMVYPGVLRIAWDVERQGFSVSNADCSILTLFEHVDDITYWIQREWENPGILEETLTGKNPRKEREALRKAIKVERVERSIALDDIAINLDDLELKLDL